MQLLPLLVFNTTSLCSPNSSLGLVTSLSSLVGQIYDNSEAIFPVADDRLVRYLVTVAMSLPYPDDMDESVLQKADENEMHNTEEEEEEEEEYDGGDANSNANANPSTKKEGGGPDPKYYKTTLCQFYLQVRIEVAFTISCARLHTQHLVNYFQGPCKNGDECNYAHGTSELRTVGGGRAAKEVVQVHQQTGLRQKTRLCEKFLQVGLELVNGTNALIACIFFPSVRRMSFRRELQLRARRPGAAEDASGALKHQREERERERGVPLRLE